MAHDEARFRHANEQIVRALHEFDSSRRELELMCECALPDCEEMVSMSRDDYGRMRTHPERFVVAVEHVVGDTERLVERGDDYWLIEKLGVGGEIARERASYRD